MRKRTKWLIAGLSAAILLLGGCAAGEKPVRLDPKNPVTITIWHYYNGMQKLAFDNMIAEFNDTIGAEQGIIVEASSYGNISQLEESVMASVNKEVGSQKIPNIFTSYADTAYEVEQMGYLVDLEKYFSEEELAEYVDSYIEEGRIGENGELKIFPVSKSTEVFMLNATDWKEFAEETGAEYADLETREGLVETAKAYYEWTDAQTPEIPADGRAFYGRDAMANLFIIGAKQLGTELFAVENGQMTLNLDREVLHKIWEFYYVPYVSGYFSSYGKFRSDDVRIGEIIALTGSTASASYFPFEVTIGEETHEIEHVILPDPVFAGGEPYMIQQGAGMVVTKSTEQQEYASAQLLRWITESEKNLELSCQSGYLPVRKEANDRELYDRLIQEKQLEVDPRIYGTEVFLLEQMSHMKLYAGKSFEYAGDARGILEIHLSDRAAADREAVEALLASGSTWDEAVSGYISEESFEAWYTAFCDAMRQAVKQ